MTGPGAWYIDLCATGTAQSMGTGVVWFATGQVPGVAAPAVAVAAAQAASELQLPKPSIRLSPAGSGYVNLPEDLWIDPALWQPLSTTAQACNSGGCTSATATATPRSVTWEMGDGGSTTCPGPGLAQGQVPVPGSTLEPCTYTYMRSSASATGAAFAVTATVTWTVSWTGAGQSGTLPDLVTVSGTALPVGEAETLNS